MLSIRKINPMARAVGTMGAIAALVGAVTFAQLQSNTVALSNNQLSSATATLAIGANTSCPDGDTSSTPGFNAKLVPGKASDPVTFCLHNKGDIPLNITASIPEDVGGSSLDWNKVTINVDCGNGNSFSSTVANLHATPQTFAGSLNNGDIWNCSATATADSSVTGGTLGTFTINFVGNQPSAT